MASTLQELVLKITGQDNASGVVNTMGSKIKKDLADIGKLAAGLALGNLGANIGMGIAERLKTAAEQIDVFGTAVRNVQVVTGESAENASVLVAMFERFGMSGDDAANKLSRLERALNGTDTALDVSVSGGKRGSQILRDLGVQYTDAAGKVLPLKDVLLNLADVWTKTDAESRNAAARGLFGGLGGGGATQMNLMLSQGKAGLEALGEAVDRYGFKLTEENIKDVVAFTFAHRDMDMALQGVSIQLGAVFMPAITSTAQAISGLTQLIVSDLVPMFRTAPSWIGPATLAVVGFGLAWKALSFVLSPVWGLLNTLVGAIFTEGATATVAAGGNTVLAGSETAAGDAAAAAVPKVGALTAAASVVAQSFLVIGAAVITFIQPLLQSLQVIEDMKASMANYDQSKLNPVQKWFADALKNFPDFKKMVTDLIPKLEMPELPKLPQLPVPEPGTKDGEGGGAGGPTETKAEKAAKAAKAAADQQVKSVQDAAAQRKDAFEMDHVEQNRGALEAKLAEAQANQALLPMKRELEDLDRASLDYAHQRLVINQDELATQARIGEEKLKNAADDLSYQEKLLLAQARAAKLRGENVDMDALRQKVLAIRTAQIQGEPGLLIAGHNTALADRAKNATSLTDQIAKDELEKRKLAIQEANQPLVDELTLRKRMTEDAQNLLELDKMRFEITETFYAKDLLLAQIAAKAADEAYQKAVAAATAAGVAPGTPPLANGVGGSPIDAREHGTAVNITNNNTVRNDADIQAIADKTTDQVLGNLQAAQHGIVRPARTDQPGAFAAATA